MNNKIYFKLCIYLSIIFSTYNNAYSVSHPVLSKKGALIYYVVDNNTYKTHKYKGSFYKGKFHKNIIYHGKVDANSNDTLFDVTTLHSIGALLANQEVINYIITSSGGSTDLYGRDIICFCKKFIERDCKKQIPLHRILTDRYIYPLDYSQNGCYCNFESYIYLTCHDDGQFIKIEELH